MVHSFTFCFMSSGALSAMVFSASAISLRFTRYDTIPCTAWHWNCSAMRSTVAAISVLDMPGRSIRNAASDIGTRRMASAFGPVMGSSFVAHAHRVAHGRLVAVQITPRLILAVMRPGPPGSLRSGDRVARRCSQRRTWGTRCLRRRGDESGAHVSPSAAGVPSTSPFLRTARLLEDEAVAELIGRLSLPPPRTPATSRKTSARAGTARR